MKKIILTLLIMLFCLPVFAKPNYSYTKVDTNTPAVNTGIYVNDEITNPITQIGNKKQTTKPKQEKKDKTTNPIAENNIPTQYTQPQQDDEEKWLEIEWNKWHADVRNSIGCSPTSNNYLKYYYYTVDKFRKISDIYVFYFKKSYGTSEYSIKEKSNPYTPNFSRTFYVCMKKNGEDKYKVYEYELNEDAVLSEDTAMTTLKRAKFVKIAAKDTILTRLALCDLDKLIIWCNDLESLSGSKFLAFPSKSQRTRMTVKYSFANKNLNLKGYSSKEWEPSDFNDIEKVKE